MKTDHSERAKALELLDTTLRDGAQAEGISFSVRDKLAIVKALDGLGIPLIEAGNPGSNPKDLEFFEAVKSLKLNQSVICSFGATRRPHTAVQSDPQVCSLLAAGTAVTVIFGKSWTLHVREVLGVTWEENLAMITESVEYLREHGMEVIYDAEHFYQGFQEDPEMALASVEAAWRAGARVVVLADTNGGTPPH